MNRDPGDEFSLEIPADAHYLTTVRVFAVAVGRQLGMSESRVDDLKLAMSDTCAWLMRWRSFGESDRKLLISIIPDGRRLLVMVESDGGPMQAEAVPPLAVGEDGTLLGLDLIEAVTQGLDIDHAVEGTIVKFSFRLDP